MQLRKLSQLNRIAQLKKEMELADLARLARRKTEAHSERDELTDAAKTARRSGQASTPEGQTAERFVGWVAMRHAEIDDALLRLTDEMASQRAKAALAVGRQDVLQQMEGHLKQMERQKRKV